MKEEKDDIEKRQHKRKEYRDGHRPTLTIRGFAFEVLNISERGLGFLHDEKMNLTGWVTGTLLFENDTTVDIEGIIVRREDGQIGLHLVDSISLKTDG